MKADIEFTSKGISNDQAIFTIKGINEDNVVQFSNTPDDISNRATTSASVDWPAEEWNQASARFKTDDIKSIVQEIVNRSGWTNTNSMGFVIEATSGTRIAETTDSDRSKSPRLNITYQTIIETPFKKNRARLIELVNELPASGLTPIGSTMLELSLIHI